MDQDLTSSMAITPAVGPSVQHYYFRYRWLPSEAFFFSLQKNYTLPRILENHKKGQWKPLPLLSMLTTKGGLSPRSSRWSPSFVRRTLNAQQLMDFCYAEVILYCLYILEVSYRQGAYSDIFHLNERRYSQHSQLFWSSAKLYYESVATLHTSLYVLTSRWS